MLEYFYNLHAQIRSNNGPESSAAVVSGWIIDGGGKTAYIELGGLGESGYAVSINGKFLDELPSCEVFSSLT